MVTVAMHTGLRVSELLALRWDHIDLEEGLMLVQQGVVNGRIGKVKTEASNDEVPLDLPSFKSFETGRGTERRDLSSLPPSRAAASTLGCSSGRF